MSETDEFKTKNRSMMQGQEFTAIFFYLPGNGNAGTLNFNEIVRYGASFSHVKAVWQSGAIPYSERSQMIQEMKEKKISRVIIAGYETGMVKSFFSSLCNEANIPVDKLMLTDFKEQGVIEQNSIDLAKAVMVCSIFDVPLESVLQPVETDVNSETLVIGGGIAGIQASLEIANAGQKIHLVERTGTIGGHMAMFDKTFPTLDCAACILTPKMVEVGQHPSIELHTYSEVKSISGDPGNFKVVILKKARRVDVSMCIGCGSCSEKCPSKAPSEFDSNTTLRKAIYIPFPQAVPNKYLIDADSCRYIQGKKCGVCVKNCPVPGCINLDEEDQEITITVGNIILATGFKPFEARKLENYGYGKYPNVLTSLEFERLINAAGPTEGKIRFRTKDKKGNWVFNPEGDSPESIAIIHCAGSRDENHKRYCSKVCCMYSLKLAHLVKEKLPEADVTEYFIDMRSFGKGYEEFYERIKGEGIQLLRGKPAEIKETGEQLLIRSEDIKGGRLLERKVDMVVLSVGLEPAEGSEELAVKAGINTDEEGWFRESNSGFNQAISSLEGIQIAGVCQGPKDIPDSVAQASAAAARVLRHTVKGMMNMQNPGLVLADIETKAKRRSTSIES